jgi:hypothetical protein
MTNGSGAEASEDAHSLSTFSPLDHISVWRSHNHQSVIDTAPGNNEITCSIFSPQERVEIAGFLMVGLTLTY